jgi:tetratricopeptide (TPR) repeat protein
MIAKKVPSFDLVFDADRQRLADSGVTLTIEQEVLLDALDGRRDVTALIDASGLGEFEVGKALYALASAGFVSRVGTSRAPEPAVSDARVDEHRNLGIAFYKTGMLDEALRELRRVLEVRPGDAVGAFYLGLALMRQDKWPAAADVCAEAATLPGARAAILHNWAYALERLGRYPEAAAALDEAVRRGAGGDPRVQTSRGALALRRGEVAEADAILSAARSLWGKRPPGPAWFHYAALAAALGGDTARAGELLAEGVTHHPHAAALFNNLAAVHERRGGYADAARHIDRGTQEDPALAQLHKNSGDYAYRTGQYDEALDAYQRATRLNPALGDDVFLKIGNIRYRRRETAEAVKCWERALELEPANAIIRGNLDAVRRAG